MIQNKNVNFQSKIVGDKLIRSIPVEYGSDIEKQEVVLTQQEFQECYKRWIMPFVSQLTSPASNVGSSWEPVGFETK